MCMCFCVQTEHVDMMEGDFEPAPGRGEQSAVHKPSQQVEGLGFFACWRLFKRGVRGAPPLLVQVSTGVHAECEAWRGAARRAQAHVLGLGLRAYE